jgi:hypothetical protein
MLRASGGMLRASRGARMFGGAGLVDGSGKTAVVFGGFGFQE